MTINNIFGDIHVMIYRFNKENQQWQRERERETVQIMIDFQWATQTAINIHFAYDEFLFRLLDKNDIVNRKKILALRIQCTKMAIRRWNNVWVCIQTIPKPTDKYRCYKRKCSLTLSIRMKMLGSIHELQLQMLSTKLRAMGAF